MTVLIWFVLTIAWFVCSGFNIVEFISLTDEDSLLIKILFLIVIFIIGPISYVVKYVSYLHYEKKINIVKYFGWLSKPFKPILLYFMKRKDHKEMDKMEDEWRIERLGIKSK